MSLARRTDIRVFFEGADISVDVSKYLKSMTYTDNEADKADDLQLSLDDRENIWLYYWLNPEQNDIKGGQIDVTVVQKNWNSTGGDRVLDCGIFEIDSLDASGPPAAVSIKATSIPYKSALRAQKKTKGWENIKLSGIAGEIAANAGMRLMYESSFNPFYKRREQIQQPDIVFLKALCEAAGISLKVTAKNVVLFDALDYESKPEIRSIERGADDVLTYKFATNYHDTAYASCHVSYTDPETGQTIEYTYKPRNGPGNNQVLEVNEKVKDREEARQLAMKRLRSKNKREYTADFTLVGDLDLVAGVTLEVKKYGMFDGKYIVEQAVHKLTEGYTVAVKLRRVLEEY